MSKQTTRKAAARLVPNHVKKFSGGLDLALLADPQQPPTGVELVDEGQVAMAGLLGDLVDANGGHAVQADGAWPRFPAMATARWTVS